MFEQWYDQYPYIKQFTESDNEQERYMMKLIEDGFKQWNQEFNDRNLSRINEELEIMALISEKLGQPIASYYVLVREMIHNILWKRSYVGVARGSVTGFYTAFLMGIVQINPLDYNLACWRHLHPSRIELPDNLCIKIIPQCKEW